MARWTLELRHEPAPVVRYGLAVASVALALGLSLVFQHYDFRDAELPVFEIAIVLAAWYLGVGPSVAAVVLSAASFNYFFTEPLYTFDVSLGDLPYFALFVGWALILAWFVTARRRIETDLRHTRDNLRVELEQRRHREAEISRLNRELGARAAELEASNKELESFAYSVSHDLRAPLRHAAGYAELLQKHAAAAIDDKGRRYIQTIIEAARRMGNLIDDLLAFSRIGRAEAKTGPVALEPLVREVVAEIGREATGRDIAWRIGPLPACHGDRSMLKLAVANLLANAVKFTRMRARADIEVGGVDKGDGSVELFVRDNGAGFDMQYANKLFGVFQRLHLPEQFEGTGIGLAIVQRIVHRHGGTVRAEGAVDQGATFYVSLPKAPPAPERMTNTP